MQNEAVWQADNDFLRQQLEAGIRAYIYTSSGISMCGPWQRNIFQLF